MNNFDHLNLGCGLNTPGGWLNVDGSWQVLLTRWPLLKKMFVAARLLPVQQANIPWSPEIKRLNLSQPLPFKDDFFKAVYSSHLIEHLHYGSALALLQECHRILVPGGVCRMVVPDLLATVNEYLVARHKGDQMAANHFMKTMMVHDQYQKTGLYGLYYRLTAFHSHKWMYDAESLQELFKSVGFLDVVQANYLESRIDRIGEVEVAGRICDGQGIVIEGIKTG